LKRKPIVFVLILIFFLCTAGLLTFSFFLPLYIEKNILPSLGDQFSTSLTGQVFTIGLNETSFGDVVVGDTPNIALSIGSINMKYSLFSIRDRVIDQVKINGLNLNLKISDGKIIIPGIDQEKIVKMKAKQEIPQHSSTLNLPLQVDNFRVSNGFLNILHESRRIVIPFGLQITKKEQTNENFLPVYQLNLQIFPQGGEIVISGSVDLSNNRGIFNISADSFNIAPFAFLLGELEKNISFGKAAIKGNTEINLMPFQHIATRFDSELESISLKPVPVIFGSSAGNVETTKSLSLNIKGEGQQWDIAAHGSMVEPITASIELDGSFLPGDDVMKGSGNILVKIDDTTETLVSVPSPVIIKGNPQLLADFSINIASSGAWQAKVKSKANKKTLTISYGQNRLSTRVPSFNIQGEGSADIVHMQVSLTISDVQLTSEDGSEINSPEAKLKTLFNQKNRSGPEGFASGEFSLSLPDVKINRETLTGQGDITFTGKIKPQPFKDIKSLKAGGKLTVENGRAEESANSISIKSINGNIPWNWPLPEKKATGRLKVTGINWGKNELGSFEAGVGLKGSSYLLDGRFTHSLLNGLITDVTGEARMSDSEFQASMLMHMDAAPFSSLHLGEFEPSLSNSYISGKLGLEGSLNFDAKGLKGSAKFIFQNGRFEFPEKKYEISDINLSMFIPSLPDLRSAPAQEILFNKASVGDLTFEQGKVVWQLEPPNSIFIEEGVVNWAGGRIFTNAVRISPEIKEFVVPIFCDRLILTEILNQFGVIDAEGQGTVSGRIPLLVSSDTIRFEDGFLFSSPGQGGSVKVAAFDVLAAGIPKNTPQFAQVDFAAEALKNFQYNWVKLLLNSEGEDLIMQMHMDGKPMQSLPFSYDSQTGLLQRIDDNTQGIKQPIRLNVNFRLPLNRFIGYSGKIQDMMENIQ
jgi:hypothetical protein